MNILIELNHPAHFHLFRNFILIMGKKGNRLGLVVKQKDVLLDLIKDLSNGFEVYVRSYNEKKGGFWNNLIWLFESDIKTFIYALKFKPNILLGSNFSTAHIGKLLGIPSFLFAEDDAIVIPKLAKMAYPFVSNVITPSCCENGKWAYKSVKYNSYHELAYLHKNYFTPDLNKIAKIYNSRKKNYLIRLSGLTAHHDTNKAGITSKIAHKIINILSPHGNVFITSERELESAFEPYRINIDPQDIHHTMYYADILICDSQTMAAEAAVLGTPSIRFNSFVGQIGYLEELEHEYGLTYGIRTSNTEKLYDKIQELLAMPNLKEEWKKRRQKMLADKIDVTAFMVWFIENYPKSVEIIKKNPDYQRRFK